MKLKYIVFILVAGLLLSFLSSCDKDTVLKYNATSFDMKVVVPDDVVSEKSSMSGEINIWTMKEVEGEMVKDKEVSKGEFKLEETASPGIYNALGNFEVPHDTYFSFEIHVTIGDMNFIGNKDFHHYYMIEEEGGAQQVTVYLEEIIVSAPSIYIFSPSQGQTFQVGTEIMISAEVYDSDGTVDQVIFRANGETLTTFDASVTNYEYYWYTGDMSPGNVNIEVFARDNDGNTSTESVEITLTGQTGGNPSVSFINPYYNQTFTIGEQVMLYVEAEDPDGTIESVMFYAGTDYIATVTQEPFEYFWDTTGQIAGDLELRAVVYDNDNNTAEAYQPIALMESGANEAPFVMIYTPTTGQNFPSGSQVYIEVSAYDLDGSIEYVEFYVDGNLIGEDPTGSGDMYEYDWIALGVPAGQYTISVTAYDNGGLSTTQEVEINITE